MMNRLAALLLPLVLLACGPVMEQRRDFTPPATEAGMQCVHNCQAQQTTCQRDEKQRSDQCRAKEDRRADRAYEKARDDYITALKLHAADSTKYPMPKEPARQANYSACNVSSQCEPQYHSCYRSCGGQINEYQVCVAACE
ncbi:hypothetical protein [Parvibaculum sp.]|uniref:hypothetical protein n=1 Tax=Parvibaculum sp. TaxID=2024848 RepID=UPI001D8EE7D8|nr:hypothetical protein [Parvibaculum sp.]MBX3490094.1 hypothetical protein [Parvibaculum sp.]MCW5725918.1 hypothetical protein [Parvibaculum sp.]